MYSLIIVDDELKIREGIANLFPWQENGFEIKALFPNGRLALDYLRSHPTDVILTDIRMPVMDGLELSTYVSKEFPDLYLVFLTGFQDYEYMRVAIQNHASDYLLKPIKYEELLSCMNQIRQTLDKKNHIPPVTASSSYYGKIIDTVCSYLQENFRSATLEEAALQVNLSPNYLSKIFKEKSGTGFSEYLNVVRMKKAAELLLDISYKHYEIADRIGYDNPKNFSRAFKQYYHMSPREFRENHLGHPDP